MPRLWPRLVASALLLPSAAFAQLEPPAPPEDPASAFYTLGTILDRLETGAVGTKRSGGFEEPTAGPATTGPTLDEILAAAPFPDDALGANPPMCLEGQRFWSLATGSWGPQTGTMPNRGGVILTPDTEPIDILLGFHDGTGRVEGDEDLVSGNIRAEVDLFGVSGDPNVVNTSSGDAVAADIVTGRRAWVDGNEVTGTIPIVQLQETSSDVPAGLYAATTLEDVDLDLASGNVRSGITVFGVVGDPNVVDTSSGTATAADLALGQRAWVDGNEIVGTRPPARRFIDNGNGSVTDTVTGLRWLRDASCPALASTDASGQANWVNAFTAARSAQHGVCGLTDGSTADDWRLPTIVELSSLVDRRFSSPAVQNGAGTGHWSEGDVFVGLQSQRYWTIDLGFCGSRFPSAPSCYYSVFFNTGLASSFDSTVPAFVWPVNVRL
ncbi:MAG: DUF1566 domain-containing protein, partial [Acidobacteria bacterium]|nr:DUF1566 domain-containing protein [Acidobacteriota bacterium]